MKSEVVGEILRVRFMAAGPAFGFARSPAKRIDTAARER